MSSFPIWFLKYQHIARLLTCRIYTQNKNDVIFDPKRRNVRSQSDHFGLFCQRMSSSIQVNAIFNRNPGKKIGKIRQFQVPPGFLQKAATLF